MPITDNISFIAACIIPQTKTKAPSYASSSNSYSTIKIVLLRRKTQSHMQFTLIQKVLFLQLFYLSRLDERSHLHEMSLFSLQCSKLHICSSLLKRKVYFLQISISQGWMKGLISMKCHSSVLIVHSSICLGEQSFKHADVLSEKN